MDDGYEISLIAKLHIQRPLVIYHVNLPHRVELSFIAVHLSLKRSTITADHVKIYGRLFNKMTEDNQKDLLSSQINICSNNARGSL